VGTAGFETSLYILDTSPMSCVWLTDIFYEPGAYLFMFFTGFFTEQNILLLMKHSLAILPFSVMFKHFSFP
jgi:hypothetical protein